MGRLSYLDEVERLEILPKLARFDPHIVGTPPLGIDLPRSDIDIVCFAPDAEAFVQTVWHVFGAHADFCIWQKVGTGRPVIASFAGRAWMIEIFGQSVPVNEQYGWRHFQVEKRLLMLGSSVFRDAVMAKRFEGLKTEPAFAAVLGLGGDPYRSLLDLERYSDIEITAMLEEKGLF